MANLGKLNQFAFHHLLREVNENIQNAEVAFLQRHLKRLHVEPVARKNAAMISPAGIRGGPSAARVRAVDYVVMNQRGAMEKLDDGGKADCAALTTLTPVTRGKNQKRGPQALSSAAPKTPGAFLTPPPRPAPP